ncbi:MAG: hypothetical protein MUF24_14450 [Chitinophagaceae bacterium]|jgi:hypothetical protein|nr:hypothetical protein [Chitinophagaceae bacterium]
MKNFNQIARVVFAALLAQGFGQQATAQTADNAANGQFYLTDITGRAITGRSSERYVSGSPWFFEYWSKAQMQGTQNIVYRDMRIMLNLLEGKVYALDTRNQEMEITSPVARIELKDSVTGRMFYFQELSAILPAKSPSGKLWCQVLSGGQWQAVRHMSRKKIESKPYGSAVTEISITENDYWYLLKNGSNPQPFKKAKDLIALLGSEVPAISSLKPAGKTLEEQVAYIMDFCSKNSTH